MKFTFWIFIFSVGFSINACYAKNCDYTGRVDASVCIQKMIDLNANNHKKLYLKRGTIKISTPLFLPNNSNIVGRSTIIKFNSSIQEMGLFNIESASNINISNINIIGTGFFSKEKFIMPYAKLRDKYPYAIGYTNLDRGVTISGNSSNININHLSIIGLEHGILIKNDKNIIENIYLFNNIIKNVGKSGITVLNSKNIQIKNNIIENVLGNMDYGKKLSVEHSKFADGIYLNGISNGIVSNNDIANVIRIGIVIEGLLDKNDTVLNSNDNIFIMNNKISNAYSSRDTEHNAGIWVEPASDKKHVMQFKTNRIIIANNEIDNQHAKLGAHDQYGIFLGAMNSIVRNNIISNFKGASKINKGIGVKCNFGNILLKDNTFSNNSTNILTESTSRFLNVL